jgi:putative tryptophan/tyrosine transport system substrate-binding protein
LCKRNTLLLATVVAIGSLVAQAHNAGAEPRVLVATSHEAAPYRQALNAFSQDLEQHGVKILLTLASLEGDATKMIPALERAQHDGTRLVLALGSLATKSASKSPLPVVACMVMSSREISGLATGVTLEHSVQTQLQWIQRILPGQRSVGLIYNPRENERKVQEAQRVARELGLSFEAWPVSSAQDIPRTLEALGNRIQVLWGLPDGTVLTPQTAKHILLFSFRNRIPLIGPSSPWVKAGALFSLDGDYADIGRQCGRMARDILAGRSPSDIPAEGPRKILYSINSKTAAHMKVELSEAVLGGAHTAY